MDLNGRYYALQEIFSSDATIYLNIRKLFLNFGLIKIRQFSNQMWLFLKNKNGVRAKETPDGSGTRVQLLNSLNVIAESMKAISEASNSITAEVKNLIAIVERMDDDSGKTGSK